MPDRILWGAPICKKGNRNRGATSKLVVAPAVLTKEYCGSV